MFEDLNDHQNLEMGFREREREREEKWYCVVLLREWWSCEIAKTWKVLKGNVVKGIQKQKA